MRCCILGCPNYGADACKDTTYHLFPHPEKDIERFQKWIDACNSPKIQSKKPIDIYRQLRICRRHFDKESKNGGCRRLLNTAIPTLFLGPNNEVETSNDAIETESVSLQEPERLEYESYYIEDECELPEFEEPSKFTLNSNRNLKRVHIETDKSATSVILKRTKYVCLSQATLQPIMTLVKDKLNPTTDTDIGTRDDDVSNWDGNQQTRCENEYELFDVVDEKFYKIPLSENTLKQWRDNFYKCEKNILAQNVCSRIDPFDVCLSRKVLENTQHVYTYKIESEGKPVTNQKNSGRCWLFAALNCIRVPFIKQYNLDEFEFSQGYLFYWDKIERCHYFLNNIIETASRGEEVTGRLVSFLLNDPTTDGGQWDMLVNLINKHGLMPKKCFPESYSCEASVRLNAILKSKLREYAKTLRDLVENGTSEEDIRVELNKMMGEIYNVVGICIGIPDEKFRWEYYDKSKAYQCVGPIKPIDFYNRYVKQCFNVDDKVCIVSDPRSTSSYGQAYTVDCLGNVIGGRPVLYNNQPVEILIDLVTTSLKNGEPVWFGCEVSKRFAGKQGIEDLTIHDFKLVFGVDIQTTMSKGDRMIYGESSMTHAMTFTAVSCDDNGVATKFRVENSWGEDRGEKGYLVMTADWFKEFVFEVVVDKSIVPKEVLQVFQQNPVVLPAWDPMGTLAN